MGPKHPGKVLVRPFDTQVHYQPNHHSIAMDLISATCEITGSLEATVALLVKDKSEKGWHPITFLIHNLTQLKVHTLLSQPVWSSNEIAFQVSPVMTMCPDFLFTILNFTTLNDNKVVQVIMDIWNDTSTSAFFDGLVKQAKDKDKQAIMSRILNFIKSMHIAQLDTKKEGGKWDPQYHVCYIFGLLLCLLYADYHWDCIVSLSRSLHKASTLILVPTHHDLCYHCTIQSATSTTILGRCILTFA